MMSKPGLSRFCRPWQPLIHDSLDVPNWHELRRIGALDVGSGENVRIDPGLTLRYSPQNPEM